MRNIEEQAIKAMKVTNGIVDKRCEECAYALEPSTSRNCKPCSNKSNFVRWGKG